MSGGAPVAGVNLRGDQLITVCGNERGFEACLFPARQLNLTFLPFRTLFSGVGFCAILYTKACCLVSSLKRYRLLLPTKILSASLSLRRLIYLPKLPAGLLFILTDTA